MAVWLENTTKLHCCSGFSIYCNLCNYFDFALHYFDSCCSLCIYYGILLWSEKWCAGTKWNHKNWKWEESINSNKRHHWNQEKTLQKHWIPVQCETVEWKLTKSNNHKIYEYINVNLLLIRSTFGTTDVCYGIISILFLYTLVFCCLALLIINMVSFDFELYFLET